ncbi:hypothetical protein [Natrialba swarupiae]|uniref:hypothetical protein n=1 Tax=Natrialba swarupiae TaxID=2448032 RepID=UPI00139107A5|nr:hypothetical protein [Natrialba swarupiae]
MKRIVAGTGRTAEGIARIVTLVGATVASLEGRRTNALFGIDISDHYHGDRTVRPE